MGRDTLTEEELITPTERKLLLAWAGGYFDGEGYLYVRGNASGIEVDSIVPAPLLLLTRLFGGSFRDLGVRGTNNRRRFRWAVYGLKAIACAKQVFPYLRVKAVEAEAVIYSKEYKQGTTMGDTMRARAVNYRKAEFNDHPTN